MPVTNRKYYISLSHWGMFEVDINTFYKLQMIDLLNGEKKFTGETYDD